ncbi:lipopolysaccharide biosynthesis protein [Mesorhizobium sp. M4B.F.Ca.ET.215.01.1.1]|uniref:lipopolysaccharide biosynthesis protein n=1 Tax=unclassified Mesorhizobium TaxID=325217 RepID=UPI000FCB7E94|nr:MULTISPECIES: lipopolysaccharide biosynthesis protein [unclassified Mesorhizobium]RUW24122.1 lipopolysaccharide biosynthesis protein [Mesorhizobium sp. M4B.F.Ca.ET.013.02.1.1]RVD45262.1 lipopolysaccharide biosynthesis protein [Mesorhizobium sp. M4B.F.Ca.ET.019.03.1.1]TGQ15395.1 lipopolysaccharide biosynthesis protein [Mesorhizobium sp. M4B.F.Ca.ET.215.01.1.1]TGQ48396.1 lipopolysaccharide biosynthesis protein [Mesorhizobium sp. M00.F.Ca.ET.220.01.1.1]TGR11459.1 lipopolysaccharide biosynthesi
MNANPPPQFGRVALRGGLVTAGSQGFKMVIQFISVIILARLLVPEDFGLVASVGPIVAFVGLLQNLGLQQALVQRKDISDRQLNQVFWVSALVGLGSSVVVAALAPAIAAFYGDQRMLGITLASALPLLLGSIAAVPLALMNRHLQFGQLALNDVVTAAAGLLAAAIAAWAGMGYWSLVLGPAVAAVVALAAAWLVVRWTPSRPDLKVDGDILSFGANLTGFNLVNFFSRNLDNILIGKYSGAIELGYYDRAYKLLLFPLQNITQPLTRVMVPLLSRIHDDKARFRDLYVRTNWMLAAVTMPGIAALTLTSDQVVALLFGPRWTAVAPIFAWLGIASLTQSVSSTTGWIFICQGKTKTMFQWGIYSSLTTVAAFIVGLHWGAVGVAAAYAISGYVLRVPVLAVLVHRVGPVTAGDFLIMQGLFIVSSLLAWLAYLGLPASLAGQSDLLAVALALCLNYGFALVLMLIFPQSRRMLSATLPNIARNIR